MKKETLLERLQLLYSYDSIIEIPLEILYDEEVWKTGYKELPSLMDFVEKRPPDEVFTRLRELDKKPHSYFGIRTGLIRRVETYRKEELTLSELTALFEKGDNLTLGKFQPLGTENDFFTKLNEWYFGALGQRAFTLDGQVPIKFPNEPLIQEVNARNLYSRIVKGDFGKEGVIIAQKWGSGGLLDPVVSFLNEMVRLDEQNGTKVYGRIRYVVSDRSQKSIQESKAKAAENENTKKHLAAGVLQFQVFDATAAASSGLANVESSYLYDSISQPIIAKVDGKFYELHYRAYLDDGPETRDDTKYETRDYRRLSPQTIKKWLNTKDWDKLSQLRSKSFNNIRWEVKLVEIADLEQYPHGRSLEEMVSDFDNVTLPTGKTSLDSIRTAANSLRPNGYVQVFDLGLLPGSTLERHSGTICRYNGAVYVPVNFHLIADALEKEGFEVKLEHLTAYLAGILGERVLPVIHLSDYGKDTATFDKFFPLDKMREWAWIVKTANKIKRREGYSDQGGRSFYWALDRAGLVDWCRHSWLDRDEDCQDYVADFRKSVRLQIFYRFDSDPMWIFEQSPNPMMVKKFRTLGFKSEIINHLFTFYQEISKDLDYYHLSVRKTN